MEEKVLLRADLRAMLVRRILLILSSQVQERVQNLPNQRDLLTMDPRILPLFTTKVEEKVRRLLSLLSLDTEVEVKTVATVTTQTSAIPTILLLLEATVSTLERDPSRIFRSLQNPVESLEKARRVRRTATITMVVVTILANLIT